MSKSMKTRIIGSGERRVDALGKVTGAAKFAADNSVAHQLYGRVLRSRHPHATITRLDVTKARALKVWKQSLLPPTFPATGPSAWL